MPPVPRPEPADGHPESPPAPASRSPRWATAARVVAAAAALAAVAGLAVGLPRPSSQPTAPPSRPLVAPTRVPGPVPHRPALAFTVRRAEVTALDPVGSRRPPRRAVRQIRAVLSRFFDAAFFDPRWWKTGPPAEAWAAFAPGARRAARADGSFGLGHLGPLVSALAPTRATLGVHFLTGPGGRPLAAAADFLLRGRGALASGTAVALESRGVLLLRPLGGRWAVVGFPRVATTVREDRGRPAPTAVRGAAP